MIVRMNLYIKDADVKTNTDRQYSSAQVHFKVELQVVHQVNLDPFSAIRKNERHGPKDRC